MLTSEVGSARERVVRARSDDERHVGDGEGGGQADAAVRRSGSAYRPPLPHFGALVRADGEYVPGTVEGNVVLPCVANGVVKRAADGRYFRSAKKVRLTLHEAPAQVRFWFSVVQVSLQGSSAVTHHALDALQPLHHQFGHLVLAELSHDVRTRGLALPARNNECTVVSPLGLA